MSEAKKEKKYSVVHKICLGGFDTPLIAPKMTLASGLALETANALAKVKFEDFRYNKGNWRMSCYEGKYDFWNMYDVGTVGSLTAEICVLEEDENGKIIYNDPNDCIDDLPF